MEFSGRHMFNSRYTSTYYLFNPINKKTYKQLIFNALDVQVLVLNLNTR